MTKKSILIVDDDVDMCFMLEKRLRANGFECRSVSSVQEAVESLESIRPDLILLDLMFRGPNGTAFLQALKSHAGSHTDHLPVLVVSGCNEEEVVDYVLNSGASGFIKKPVDTETLLSMINEYIAAA